MYTHQWHVRRWLSWSLLNIILTIIWRKMSWLLHSFYEMKFLQYKEKTASQAVHMCEMVHLFINIYMFDDDWHPIRKPRVRMHAGWFVFINTCKFHFCPLYLSACVCMCAFSLSCTGFAFNVFVSGLQRGTYDSMNGMPKQRSDVYAIKGSYL